MRTFALFVVVLTLFSCDSNLDGRATDSLTTPSRDRDSEQILIGASIYQQHCAACHGENGEGDPEWRVRNADGSFPPPPLNGSGHSWHHSTPWLEAMILNGSQVGQGKMPAWKGKLNKQEIAAVVVWFQSQWPDRVYAAWFDMQQRQQHSQN